MCIYTDYIYIIYVCHIPLMKCDSWTTWNVHKANVHTLQSNTSRTGMQAVQIEAMQIRSAWDGDFFRPTGWVFCYPPGN